MIVASGTVRGRSRSYAMCLALVLFGGCGDRRIRILERVCEPEDEQVLALVDAPLVHDVALVNAPGGFSAIWSERAGLFVRPLDARGVPTGTAQRVAAACDGGLAAQTSDGVVLVACGRRGDDARESTGGVQLLEIGPDGTTRSLDALGELGPDGTGVALAVGADGRVVVGWQRARGAVSEAFVQTAGEADLERLSDPRFRASRPTLAWHGDRLLRSWAETWIGARGRPEGRLLMQIGARAAYPITEVAYDEALPVLRTEGDAPLLTFRDRRPAGSRPRVFFGRVTTDRADTLRPEGGSHANAVGESIAFDCGGSVFVVAPRTHSRTERLVSLRRFTRELSPSSAEIQLYEHGSTYEHADARCVDGHPVVLFASRPGRVHPRGSVRTVALTCGDGAASVSAGPDARR